MAKSKRKRTVDDETPPRRLSRRINNLQEDGTPVRSSLRLREASEREGSARKNLAVSITQSAKVASRFKKRKKYKSIYDLDYHRQKQQRNEIVSPSQINNLAEDESTNLNPIVLDSEFETFVVNGISDKNIRKINDGNESNSESFNDCIHNSPTVDSEKSMSYMESESEVEVNMNDNLEDVEAPPSLNENSTIHRICYCDMLTLPLDCEDCNRQLCIPCERHIIMKCFECGKKMHKGCLEDYLGGDLNDFNEDEVISCLECFHNDVNESVCWDSLVDDDIKRMRFGLFPDDDVKKVNKMIKILNTDCYVPPHIINSIKDNDPQPYTSITPISSESKKKHTICGRRFDVSMMMFSVHTCDCCGVTMPFHKDRYYPKDATFEKSISIKHILKLGIAVVMVTAKVVNFMQQNKLLV